jgi:hypothetical protein
MVQGLYTPEDGVPIALTPLFSLNSLSTKLVLPPLDPATLVDPCWITVTGGFDREAGTFVHRRDPINFLSTDSLTGLGLIDEW